MNEAHTREFFLSEVLGKSIRDAGDSLVGRLRDMAVRWDAGCPVVTGIKYARDEQNHIAAGEVAAWSTKGLRLRRRFEETERRLLQPEEIYVSKWLLDKQIIDMKGSKLVRINDIKLGWVELDGSRKLVLLAVDVGVRGLLRRVGLEFLARRWQNRLLSWRFIMPLETRTADLKLLLDPDRAGIGRLHPADLADIIENLTSARRLELLGNLDNGSLAWVLSEIKPETRRDILEEMDDQRILAILQEMGPDEVADVLGQLPGNRSDRLLGLMQAEQANAIRRLMEYPPDTAGALMTTEYIFFSPWMSAGETIERLRGLSPAAETIYYLYVLDQKNALLGVVSLRQLLIAAPDQTLEEIMERRVINVGHRDDRRTVLETIAKYDLLAVPVVDDQGIMLGIITVDDIIEAMLPDRSNLETFSHYLLRGKLARRRGS